MPRALLIILTSVALLILLASIDARTDAASHRVGSAEQTITINRDAVAGLREPSPSSHVIGGKGIMMTGTRSERKLWQRKLRIDGALWTMKLAKERQVFNGQDSLVLVDVDRREIRVSSRIRAVIAEGIAAARKAVRDYKLRQARERFNPQMGLILGDTVEGDCFSVRINGNSMEPVYFDRDRVTLERVDAAAPAAVVGRDCMFLRQDGQSTFKRLHRIMPDGTLILRALNSHAFPELFKVSAGDLRLLAFARRIERDVSYHAPPMKEAARLEPPRAAQPTSKGSKRKSIKTAA
jgi:hypothetical protein